MLAKILVPLDGSPLASRILPHIRGLLVRTAAEVVLVRVVSDGELARESRPGEDALSIARDQTRKVRDVLEEQGARVTDLVLTGDPATRLTECAREQRVDLIAISTHGRSGISRLVRGSVAETVLRTSPVPLLLANPSAGEGQELRFADILVPLDGSKVSAEILPLVIEIAQLYGSEVVLAHPADVTLKVAIGFGALTITSRNATGEVERISAPIEGVSVRTRCTIGPAAASILQLGREESADLIAMTTHGRSALSRWAHGSVTEEVLRLATCPLLVRRTLEVEDSRGRGEPDGRARTESWR